MNRFDFARVLFVASGGVALAWCSLDGHPIIGMFVCALQILSGYGVARDHETAEERSMRVPSLNLAIHYLFVVSAFATAFVYVLLGRSAAPEMTNVVWAVGIAIVLWGDKAKGIGQAIGRAFSRRTPATVNA